MHNLWKTALGLALGISLVSTPAFAGKQPPTVDELWAKDLKATLEYEKLTPAMVEAIMANDAAKVRLEGAKGGAKKKIDEPNAFDVKLSDLKDVLAAEKQLSRAQIETILADLKKLIAIDIKNYGK